MEISPKGSYSQLFKIVYFGLWCAHVINDVLFISTGTHIYTDKAVSVVVGTRSFPGVNGAPYFFSEQLVPVTEWGTEFVLIGLLTQYGSIVHITSSVRRTVVQLTGFKQNTIRIPSRGQTIRRRLLNGVTCHVKSNKAIQVMMYHGLGTTQAVETNFLSMTLVPALQHFKICYETKCPNSDNSYFQYTTYFNGSMSHGIPSGTVIKVPYTEYEVVAEDVTVTGDKFKLATSASMIDDFRYFGGVMKCGTAMFPIGPMTLDVSVSRSFVEMEDIYV